MERPFNRSFAKKVLLGNVLVPIDEPPASANNPKHVVVVMDDMKGFTMAQLGRALENLIGDNCTVTLLGVMPWLNIPLSSKIWLDVWPVEIDNLSSLQERNEWRSDVRYLKLQVIIDLCRKYGINESQRSKFSSRIDPCRHQRKNREFYTERILCNMVMMNESGEGDMIKGRCVFNRIDWLSTTGESPAMSSMAPTPHVLISEQLREILREKIKEIIMKDVHMM